MSRRQSWERSFPSHRCSLHCEPATDSPDDQAAADYCEWELTKSVKGGVRKVAEALCFGGLIDGYIVSEKVRGHVDDGEHKGKWP